VTVGVDGDAVRPPLTAESTLGEWLNDPQGAELLGQALAAASPEAAGMAAEAEISGFVQSLPLSRLGNFPRSPFSPEAIEKLVAAANS
jgi:beta-glucosidase